MLHSPSSPGLFPQVTQLSGALSSCHLVCNIEIACCPEPLLWIRLLLDLSNLFYCKGVETIAFLAYHSFHYLAVYNVAQGSESVSNFSLDKNFQSLGNDSTTYLKAHDIDNLDRGFSVLTGNELCF